MAEDIHIFISTTCPKYQENPKGSQKRCTYRTILNFDSVNASTLVVIV